MTNASNSNTNSRFIITDAEISKISDLDKSTVKMLFRLLISELLYLKDYYLFNLDCRIGIISVS